MKLLMVVYDQNSYCTFFPLGLAYLASAIRNTHPDVEIEVWQQDIYHYSDDELTVKLDSDAFDIVMISVIGGLQQFQKLLSLSKAIDRCSYRKKLRYLIGGHGPAAAPKYYLQQTKADVCGIGEGEITLPELVDVFKGKRDLSSVNGIAYFDDDSHFVMTPSRELISDVDSIAWPAWDLFDINYYAMYRFPNILPEERSMVMLTGRGCTFHCNFCYRMDQGFRPRSSASIIQEINYLKEKYRIKYFYFADELLMSSKERTISLCRAMLDNELNIHWWCNGRLNYVDDEVLAFMKQAGCVCINYGIESLDSDSRKIMKKCLSDDMIINGVQKTREFGITPALNIIYGNIDEPLDALDKATQFLLEYDDHRDFHTIHFVAPFPGTELFNEAVRRGSIQGVADFYESKHVSYDLLTTNFTRHNRLDIYRKMYEANSIIVKNHYEHLGRKHIENRYRILREEIDVLTARREEYTEKIICLIRDAMPKEQEITLESNLKDDLGIDSMMMFRLLVDCEEQFDIRFDPAIDDLNEIFQTVNSLLLAIERKKDGD